MIANGGAPLRIFSATVLLMVASSCSDRRSATSDATVHVTKESPPQAQLAARDSHRPDVPRTLVDDFDRVLTALEIRCVEARDGNPSLFQIAVDSVGIAKSNGHDISHLVALRTLEASIHEGADMKIDCTAAAKRLF